MTKQKVILEKAKWENLYAQMVSLIPEAFDSEGHPLNLIQGQWQESGNHKPFSSSIDGTLLGVYPNINLDTCKLAVKYSHEESIGGLKWIYLQGRPKWLKRCKISKHKRSSSRIYWSGRSVSRMISVWTVWIAV